MFNYQTVRGVWKPMIDQQGCCHWNCVCAYIQYPGLTGSVHSRSYSYGVEDCSVGRMRAAVPTFYGSKIRGRVRMPNQMQMQMQHEGLDNIAVQRGVCLNFCTQYAERGEGEVRACNGRIGQTDSSVRPPWQVIGCQIDTITCGPL